LARTIDIALIDSRPETQEKFHLKPAAGNDFFTAVLLQRRSQNCQSRRQRVYIGFMPAQERVSPCKTTPA
jgi:hypothetical protein